MRHAITHTTRYDSSKLSTYVALSSTDNVPKKMNKPIVSKIPNDKRPRNRLFIFLIFCGINLSAESNSVCFY
jgi:hypothetical protein